MKLGTIGKLATHLIRDHQATKEGVSDIVRYFIEKMFPEPIRPVLRDENDDEVQKIWGNVRCHYPGCDYFSTDLNRMQHHIELKHKTMKADIATLGWFWGIIRTIVRQNPKTTIATTLGQGGVWQCEVEGCGQFFSDPNNTGKHFSIGHGGRTLRGFKPPMRKLTQKWEMRDRQSFEQRIGTHREEADRRDLTSEGAVLPEQAEESPVSGIGPPMPQPIHREEERREHADLGLRIDPRMIAQRHDEEREVEHRQKSREDIIRRGKSLQKQVDSGVNIPQLTTQQMREVKQGLIGLFADEINPLLVEFQPQEDDSDEG
jgi:hypothetical protein